MICRADVRRFDGDAAPSLHAAVLPRGAAGLRFVAWTTIDKGTARYVADDKAPAFTIAWVPAERVSDESSSATEIDAALSDPDQIPLVVDPGGLRATTYFSDHGSAFPTVGIKGQAMVLAVRVESIEPGTHGQLTFGWRKL